MVITIFMQLLLILMGVGGIYYLGFIHGRSQAVDYIDKREGVDWNENEA